jgi:hypothetical protein
MVVVRTMAVAGQRKDHAKSRVKEYRVEDECDEEMDKKDWESAVQAHVEDREAFKTLFRSWPGGTITALYSCHGHRHSRAR